MQYTLFLLTDSQIDFYVKHRVKMKTGLALLDQFFNILFSTSAASAPIIV